MRKVGLVLILCICYVQISVSQSTHFFPDISLAKIIGEEGEYWTPGVGIGIHIFDDSPTHVSFGIRIAYNRLPPQAEKHMELGGTALFGPYFTTYDYSAESSSGAFSIIEILPSMMISPFNDHNSKNLFLGVGLYGLIWDVRVKGTYTSEHSTTKIEIDSPRINKQTKIGIQTGLLFTIKTRLTVKSSYNLILTDDQVTQYFTLGIGYKFSK